MPERSNLKETLLRYKMIFLNIQKNYSNFIKIIKKRFLLKIGLLIIFGVFMFISGVVWHRDFHIEKDLGVPDKKLEDAQIRASIKKGIDQKIIYIDNYHAEEPADLSIFNHFGIKAYVSSIDIVGNKNRLFECGLLLMKYAIGKKEMSKKEYAVIRQYITNGGRILLLCPAWVWIAYDKKPLPRLPYYKIAKYFDLSMTIDMVDTPLKIVNPAFAVKDIKLDKMKVAFSSIDYDKAEPIITGKNGKTAVVAAKKGNSKIIVWAQNNLLVDEFSLTPHGKELIERFFSWLYK